MHFFCFSYLIRIHFSSFFSLLTENYIIIVIRKLTHTHTVCMNKNRQNDRAMHIQRASNEALVNTNNFWRSFVNQFRPKKMTKFMKIMSDGGSEQDRIKYSARLIRYALTRGAIHDFNEAKNADRFLIDSFKYYYKQERKINDKNNLRYGANKVKCNRLNFVFNIDKNACNDFYPENKKKSIQINDFVSERDEYGR